MKTEFKLALMTLFLPLILLGQSIPSPREYLGVEIGADRTLIDWNQITRYFRFLDNLSDRVQVVELGSSTLGKPMIMAVISSEKTLQSLKAFKAIQKKLNHPEGLSEEERQDLIQKAKTVVLITMNIHATEIGSSQESVELAWELATCQNDEVRAILENTIILIIPSVNPDGQQMVTDWYRQQLGTPHEGCRLPTLYHHYAGHDNNRDWFFFNLAESRAVSPVLYHEWFPEIILDQHQMGWSWARMFVPPYSDPVNPHVHPSAMALTNLAGKHMAADLHANGFKGVVSGQPFNAYFEGTLSKTPLWHNRIGILTEMASVRFATPLYFPRGSLGDYGTERLRYSRVTDFLDPWNGGWWRLRDIIDYEKTSVYSLLGLASRDRQRLVAGFLRMNEDAIAKGKTEAPFFFIVPLDQHDPNSAAEMLRRLTYNGVEILQAQKPFNALGAPYKAGTYLISTAQSCRPCILDLLTPQHYPNLTDYPDGPPTRPYDFTGWNLPFLMGVDVVPVTEALSLTANPVEIFDFTETAKPSDNRFLVERRFLNSYTLVNRMARHQQPVSVLKEPILLDDHQFPAGTWVVPAHDSLAPWLDDLDLPAQPLKKTANMTPLTSRRLGIYQSYTASMDEGWTRLVLDRAEFKYEILHDGEIKKGRLAKSLDVIILPDLSLSSLIQGIQQRGQKVAGEPTMPRNYLGGLGQEGTNALNEFVKKGGTLICLGRSTRFAIDELHLPAEDVLKNIDRNDFYSPGSLLKVTLDTSHPLAAGMENSAIIRFNNSPTFRMLPYHRECRAVAWFEDANPLKSGWMRGWETIAGKTVMADIPLGQGRVILYGFGVQSRAQTYGTFKLLFNGLIQ